MHIRNHIVLSEADVAGLAKIQTIMPDGKHFTQVYDDDWLHKMNLAGYIRITRPIGSRGRPLAKKRWMVELV